MAEIPRAPETRKHPRDHLKFLREGFGLSTYPFNNAFGVASYEVFFGRVGAHVGEISFIFSHSPRIFQSIFPWTCEVLQHFSLNDFSNIR
jgi:hypothetical protein